MTQVHPWQGIPLDVYEAHMNDPSVGQLQQLQEITGRQLAEYAPDSVAILGVAGGNGLELIDTVQTERVYGYDVNPVFLATCQARHGSSLGDRLKLVEARIDRDLRLEHVDLAIANLVVEYVGLAEFVLFAEANASEIAVLSSVLQRNGQAGFVSETDHAAVFKGLATASSDIDPGEFATAMDRAGYVRIAIVEYPLPNGKTFVRQDFRSAKNIEWRDGLEKASSQTARRSIDRTIE